MVVFKGFMYVMAVLITISFWLFIDRLATYFKSKETHQNIINEKEKHYSSSLSLPECLDATVDLLTLCNTLIDAEISKSLQGSAIINAKYNLQRLDTDLQLISSNVYNALNKEKILDSDLLLMPEYFLQYINNETFLRLITAVQAYNSHTLDDE